MFFGGVFGVIFDFLDFLFVEYFYCGVGEIVDD